MRGGWSVYNLMEGKWQYRTIMIKEKIGYRIGEKPQSLIDTEYLKFYDSKLQLLFLFQNRRNNDIDKIKKK